MYSLMIVDDEYMILRGMAKILDWDALNIKIVKEERSPLKALDYLKDNHVDILISDMNMAEMAGTKFLPAVKEIEPDIQIIVLSGYNDFDYAKTGLEQGVIDYLNKPVDPDELEEVIEKTKGIIKRASRRKENSQIAKSIRIKDVLNGVNSIGELDVENKNYFLVAVLDSETVIKPILEKDPNIVGTYSNQMDSYIIYGDDEASLKRLLSKLKAFGLTVIVSDRTPESKIASVAAVLEKYLAWLHFYGSPTKEINLKYASCVLQPLDVAQISKKLNFDEMSVTEFRDNISQAINQLRLHYNSIVDAKYYARLVLMSIYGSNQVVDANITEAIAKVEHIQSSAKVVDLLTKFYADYRKNEEVYPEPINQVIKIIRTRYSESLSLTEVANELHLNAVYLGALFKKHTEKTFAQFLNAYRISKSIELMRSTDKDINDIALECGYQNSNYFFRVFKKQTQMAPSEYRKMMKKH